MTQRRPGFPARIPSSSDSNASSAFATRRTALVAPGVSVGSSMNFAAVRARMVQRLAVGGITAAPVLQAMGTIERHCFVDTALGNQSYEDTSLPIGLGQTISKPSIVARMAELLLGAEGARAGGLGRVLEVGTGCGYQAAVLSLLAREVYSIERLRGLHEKARTNLRYLRLTNVHLIFGDGMLGYAKGGPYAAIVSAAGGTSLPLQWCEQLAVGGRLVAPISRADGQQMLLVVDKTPHGLKQSVLEPVHFVPLKSGIA